MYRWRHMTSFWHQMAVLLRSGVPLHQTLPLAGGGSGATVAKWSIGLADDCNAGLSLEEALRRHNAPELTCAIIAAGEHCGRLPDICDHLAALYDAMLAARRDLLGRLLYPLLVLHAALLLPAVPAAVHHGESWRLAVGPLILWGAVAILWGGWRLIGRRSAARLTLMPPLSVLGRPFIARQLCLVLGVAAEAGMLHDRALLLAASASGNRIVSARLQVAAQAMTAGGESSIAATLDRLAVLDRGSVALIASGEQAGALPEALRQAAGLEGERLRQRVSWTIRLTVTLVMALAMIVTLMQVVNFWLAYIGQIRAVL